MYKRQDDKGAERYSTEIQCNEFTFLTPKNENTSQSKTQNTTQQPTTTPPINTDTNVDDHDDLPF